MTSFSKPNLASDIIQKDLMDVRGNVADFRELRFTVFGINYLKPRGYEKCWWPKEILSLQP